MMKLLINNKKISRPFRLSIKVPVYIYARGVPCRRETVFIISGQGGYTALCNTPDLNRNVEPLYRSAEEVIKEESELTCQYLEPSSFYVSNITNLREEAGGRALRGLINHAD